MKRRPTHRRKSTSSCPTPCGTARRDRGRVRPRGCYPNSPSGLIDQTYGAAASFYANLVRYFRTALVASGSETTTYTSSSLTDTAASFAGDTGDCITATVVDGNGFPDWVTGTIASVSGDTLTLTGNWSSAESYDTEAGNGLLGSTTPVAGAAYNIASCTPPGGLSSPADAKPWPVPPSVGTVQYFEVGNEVDLSNWNLLFSNPSLPAPTPTLTGVNVAGGMLKAGTTYTYEMASAGARADATSGGGGLSTPGAQVSITLPSGDDAVQISWSATSNDDLTPYGYVIYGRTTGSQLGLAAVGRIASGGLTWTDTGSVTPSGAPNTTDQSAGGNVLTPGVYYQMWNVIAPAMKAVDSSVKLNGPVESNSASYGSPSVDTSCVTTNGLNSTCTNGDAGWVIPTDYIPTLLTYGKPLPNVITFHAYGSATSDTPEASTFSSINSYEIANYKSTDEAAIDAANIPVWIDEANVDANDTGAPNTGEDLRSMTQMGSAWLADDMIQWTSTDSHIQHIVTWAANSADTSWEQFGTSNRTGDTSCVPQPSCQDILLGQPDLEYWTMYEINQWFTAGSTVQLTGLPSGFNGIAVQTGPKTIVMAVVNTQQGNDDGNGAAGSYTVQLQGASVADTKLMAINGSTDLSAGPTTQDLGAQSSVTVNAAGYEVDLIQFTLS